MQRYALIGWPVKHSVSPRMQEAGFRALGIPASYELVETPPEHLGETFARLRDAGYAGWNVTVPHKERVPELVDSVDAVVVAAGSANTVVNRAGRLCATSTDGYGLAQAIHESFAVPVAGRTFTFVGTGGAARATSVFFATHGAARLWLMNRTPEKALRLAATIRRAAPECRVECLELNRDATPAEPFSETDVIIQATSLGLRPDDPLPFNPAHLRPGQAVMDMIYGQTPLLRTAAARGCRTADGRGMLLHQGTRSFEFWTGTTAPVEAMRTALAAAIDHNRT